MRCMRLAARRAEPVPPSRMLAGFTSLCTKPAPCSWRRQPSAPRPTRRTDGAVTPPATRKTDGAVSPPVSCQTSSIDGPKRSMISTPPRACGPSASWCSSVGKPGLPDMTDSTAASRSIEPTRSPSLMATRPLGRSPSRTSPCAPSPSLAVTCRSSVASRPRWPWPVRGASGDSRPVLTENATENIGQLLKLYLSSRLRESFDRRPTDRRPTSNLSSREKIATFARG
eukprot:7385579-Prymnesium_polylepis.1